MWIEKAYTDKFGIDAIRDYLREKKVKYLLLAEGEDNEVNVSLGRVNKMDLMTYKVENNRIYLYEE